MFLASAGVNSFTPDRYDPQDYILQRNAKSLRHFAFCPGNGKDVTSDHFGLHMNVINKHGRPYSELGQFSALRLVKQPRPAPSVEIPSQPTVRAAPLTRT